MTKQLAADEDNKVIQREFAEKISELVKEFGGYASICAVVNYEGELIACTASGTTPGGANHIAGHAHRVFYNMCLDLEEQGEALGEAKGSA